MPVFLTRLFLHVFLYLFHKWTSTQTVAGALAWLTCLTLAFHTHTHTLTLGISSGGEHSNGPTLSHLGDVDGNRVCHGPGAEAG